MSGESICVLGEAGEPTPAHYLNELYGESDDEEQQPISDSESDFDEYDELEEPIAPPYSPLTSPEHCADDSLPDSLHSTFRSRSRSPVNVRSPYRDIPRRSGDNDDDSYLIVFEEDNEALLSESPAAEEFYDPDVHARFTSDDVDARRIRGRVCTTRRGYARGRGRGRGRPGQGFGGGRRRQAGERQWVVGDPLHEIWTSDNDVPPELKQMVRDVLMRRQRVRERSTVNEGNECEREDGDELYQDAIGGRVIPLEGKDLHFEWSDTPFEPKEETFMLQRTGSVEFYTTAYDAFRSFWDDDILEHIAAETNRYASNISAEHFKTHWYPTNAHEVLCLFAFWMMLGIIRMPTISSCFSLNPLLRTDIFRKIFARDRYKNLLRALHFVDTDPKVLSANPTTSVPSASLDRIHRLRPIVDYLDEKFKANYIPSKDISIDESLTLWKGRLNFKQYIRSKAAKFGIKTFELCESATGYLWSFIVYSGKQNSVDVDDTSDLTSTAVVKKLIGPLLNRGYRLFMDNWFNSPLLAHFLKRNKTDCVGTLRTYHKDVPYLVAHAPLERGQLIARNSGDVCVLAWQDKKRVTMISTCHGSATALSNVYTTSDRPLHYKPQVVLDYNRSMGGVDLKDQMLEPYLLERKRGKKWYMKLFKRLLNCSILNARILLESSLQHRQDHLAFRLQLVESILSHHHDLIPDKSVRFDSALPSDTTGIIVKSTHWPVYMIKPGLPQNNRQYRKRCVLCLREGRKNQKTPYFCSTCRVPLCAVYCFEKYHSAPSSPDL